MRIIRISGEKAPSSQSSTNRRKKSGFWSSAAMEMGSPSWEQLSSTFRHKLWNLKQTENLILSLQICIDKTSRLTHLSSLLKIIFLLAGEWLHSLADCPPQMFLSQVYVSLLLLLLEAVQCRSIPFHPVVLRVWKKNRISPSFRLLVISRHPDSIQTGSTAPIFLHRIYNESGLRSRRKHVTSRTLRYTFQFPSCVKMDYVKASRWKNRSIIKCITSCFESHVRRHVLRII